MFYNTALPDDLYKVTWKRIETKADRTQMTFKASYLYITLTFYALCVEWKCKCIDKSFSIAYFP